MSNKEDNDLIRKARKKENQHTEEKIRKENTDDNIEKIDSNNDEPTYKKYLKYQKKIYICIACFFALIIIMYLGSKRYDNLVYPDITLYEEDLSKLNEKELNAKVDDLVSNINNNKVIVKINNEEYEVLVSDIIKKIDADNLKKEIMNYGKDKTFIEQFGLIYLSVERNYKFNMEIDENALQKEVKKIYDDTYVAAINPTLEMKDYNLKIIKGKNGKSIDEDNLIDEICEKINSYEVGENNIVIEEEYKVVKPQISEEDLKGVKHKISTATTYFAGTGNNRGLNIVNAASKIDGTLLMPGEEFSYEDKVSPVELSNGYYMAPVIVNGTHKNAPGGGVCQVSTTLYNAQLKAGILPTERYNHSKAVAYVQKGLDATLATGSKNLRFKNPYDYPVYIHAYIVGGQITVEFWSNKSVLNDMKYTPVSFVKGNVAKTYLYGYNNKGELVYKKFIDTSVYG